MSDKEIDYCLEQFSQNNIGYRFKDGSKITFFKVFSLLKELTIENRELKVKLNCIEIMKKDIPEDTEFIILTRENYNRLEKQYASKEN